MVEAAVTIVVIDSNCKKMFINIINICKKKKQTVTVVVTVVALVSPAYRDRRRRQFQTEPSMMCLPQAETVL